ncbi:MAG TPA: hypothetical protein EYP04_07600, partial [Anaerolineae bacterium]|nr:hypothetical protein [Anaerolineae bacterium]
MRAVPWRSAVRSGLSDWRIGDSDRSGQENSKRPYSSRGTMTENTCNPKSCGWVGKILWVNLSDRTVRTLDTMDYGPQYIGGRGIAARIAWDSLPRGVGAFDPENLLMIFTGPLTGTTAPFSGRTAICGLSPQGWPHEWFSRSNLGAHWGPSLKYAGYDGLVIEGKADRPTTLWIEDGQVRFLDAGHLWGKGTMETQKILLSELGAGVRVLTIGQAGEKLSRIATISTETGSAAGQGGYGAVMGSKKLKAIAVRGSGPVYVAQPDLFVTRCKAIVEEVRTGTPWSLLEPDDSPRPGPVRTGCRHRPAKHASRITRRSP